MCLSVEVIFAHDLVVTIIFVPTSKCSGKSHYSHSKNKSLMFKSNGLRKLFFTDCTVNTWVWGRTLLLCRLPRVVVQLWNLPHWRHSRTIWTQFCAKCPRTTLGQGCWPRCPLWSLPLCDSMKTCTKIQQNPCNGFHKRKPRAQLLHRD